MNVRWGMRRSQFFAVFNGVRQLAVSFHLLFLMFLLIFLLFDYDNLSLGVISDLCSSDADDMMLICPSVNIVIGLQYMLDVCVSIGDSISLQFNASKSHCMAIGKMSKFVNEPIAWAPPRSPGSPQLSTWVPHSREANHLHLTAVV